MKKIDWNNVQEVRDGETMGPIPGGYAAKIVSVEDREDKEYLRIEWDFADGEFKGHNAETFERAGFWPCSLIRSYKPKALGFFKAFKTALEESNPGYKFDEMNVQGMVGKYIGVVLGEEEYMKNNGTVGTRLYVAQVRSGKAIREGDFKVPETKKLAQKSAPAIPVPAFEPIEDEGDLPF